MKMKARLTKTMHTEEHTHTYRENVLYVYLLVMKVQAG